MYIKDLLCLKGIRPIDRDIPYIQHVLSTIQQAQVALYPYRDLNEEVPLVVIDPEVIKNA